MGPVDPWRVSDGIHGDFEPIGVLESVRLRYERTAALAPLTLARLRKHEAFGGVVAQLRQKGWRDWHILQAIVLVCVNYRMNLRRPQGEAELREYMLRAAESPETDASPVVPLERFTVRDLELALRMSMVSTLRGLGLVLKQSVPDFGAVEALLGRRYGYWSDDVPHADPFAREA